MIIVQGSDSAATMEEWALRIQKANIEADDNDHTIEETDEEQSLHGEEEVQQAKHFAEVKPEDTENANPNEIAVNSH